MSKFAAGFFGSLGGQMEDQRKSDVEQGRQTALLKLKGEIDGAIQEKALTHAEKLQGARLTHETGERQLDREAASARDRARMEFDGALKAYEFAADERRFNAQQATAARQHSETMERMRQAYELAKTKAEKGEAVDGEKVMGRLNDNLTATARLVEAGVITPEQGREQTRAAFSLFGQFVPGAAEAAKRLQAQIDAAKGPGDAGANGAPVTGAKPAPAAARPTKSREQQQAEIDAALNEPRTPMIRGIGEGIQGQRQSDRARLTELKQKQNRTSAEKAELERLRQRFGE